MTEQKPMNTADAAKAADEAKQRRMEASRTKFTDRHLEDRIRAAHPHGFENDDAHKAMMADYDRLVAEQQKSQSQGQGHGGDPGHQGQGQGQANAPGQQPDAQPKR